MFEASIMRSCIPIMCSRILIMRSRIITHHVCARKKKNYAAIAIRAPPCDKRPYLCEDSITSAQSAFSGSDTCVLTPSDGPHPQKSNRYARGLNRYPHSLNRNPNRNARGPNPHSMAYTRHHVCGGIEMTPNPASMCLGLSSYQLGKLGSKVWKTASQRFCVWKKRDLTYETSLYLGVIFSNENVF